MAVSPCPVHPLARRPPRRDHRGPAPRPRRQPTATRQRLAAAGFLRCVAKGVYVIATAPVTLEQRCAVMSAAHPGGFVTGPTAGMLAGLRRMPRSSALHFSTQHGVHVTQDTGIHFRQTTVIWAIDRHVRPDGIIVASWPRLAFDLAADLPQLDHVSVVQQLLHEQRVTGGRARGHRSATRTSDASRVRRVPPDARHRSARHPTSRTRRSSSPMRCVGAGVPIEHQTTGDPRLERAHGAHRSRRAGDQVGHRARHPPRAPHVRRTRSRRPATAQPAWCRVADRGGHRARHGRRRAARRRAPAELSTPLRPVECVVMG